MATATNDTPTLKRLGLTLDDLGVELTASSTLRLGKGCEMPFGVWIDMTPVLQFETLAEAATCVAELRAVKDRVV